MRSFAVVLLLVAACDDAHPVAPLYRADPLAAENPVPDDRLRDPTTGALRLAERDAFWRPYLPDAAVNPTLETVYRGYAAQLAGQDGWGTYAPIAIGFDGPLDPETVTPDGFRVVAAGAAPVELDVAWHADPGFVTLHPRAPLAPDTAYRVAVLRSLESEGRAIEPAPERDQAAIAELASALAIEPAEIALAFTFTTDRPTADLESAAALLTPLVPSYDLTPVADNPRWPRGVFTRDAFLATFPPGELHDQLALSLATAGTIAVGTYASRDFRGADGVFDPALIAGDTPAPAVDVEFVLVLPDRMVHPPPWPVTIVQHGFSGTAQDALARARAFTDLGIATIGIDAVEHGVRGDISGFLVPEDLRVIRENFRQSVLDLFQLCRLVYGGGIDLVPPAAPDFDGRCSYIGQSMGGVLGGMYAAIAHDTDVAVLNVAGGGLTSILQSPTLGSLVRLLFQPALGLTGNDPGWDGNLPFLVVLSQTLLEPADPINYGPLVLADPDRRVLMQSGLGDSLVPDATARALAGSIGIPELTMPVTDAAGVSGQWWVDLADFGIAPDPGGDNDPHGILGLVPGVPRQAAAFMASGGTDVVDPATVNEPFAPVP
jgi:hypothetical protein